MTVIKKETVTTSIVNVGGSWKVKVEWWQGTTRTDWMYSGSFTTPDAAAAHRDQDVLR